MPQVPGQIALSQAARAPLPGAAIDPERMKTRALAGIDDSQKTAQLASLAALEKKGEDVLMLDLRGMSGYTDFLVIVSGNNERQLEAVADGVEKALKEAGHRLVGHEGSKNSRWLLLDFGDVVVHVFHEDERHRYDLEGLWADAPRTRVDAAAAAAKPQVGQPAQDE